jgi:hypothetical protein
MKQMYEKNTCYSKLWGMYLVIKNICVYLRAEKVKRKT